MLFHSCVSLYIYVYIFYKFFFLASIRRQNIWSQSQGIEGDLTDVCALGFPTWRLFTQSDEFFVFERNSFGPTN
jgi:hypothetical protein